MNQGDVVLRKSYGGDIMFRIEQMERDRAVLKGVEFRLLADSPLNDLMPAGDSRNAEELQRQEKLVGEMLHWTKHYQQRQLAKHRRESEAWQKQNSGQTYFEVPGKVLHLDGDPSYLRKSMTMYGELRVPAEGLYIQESQMAEALYRLLPKINPNIVVITGHDGILKNRQSDQSLDSYKNSQHFVNAVQVARQYERNMDSLTVVAGACQSHFQALLQAGANFASSPARVLIHALDPVTVSSRVAYTSVKDTMNVFDIISHTISGTDGLGGIESRGSLRVGVPRPV